MKEKLTFIIFMIITLSGCAGFSPKTTEEFKNAPSAFLIKGNYSIGRGLESVLKSVKREGMHCYTGWEGGYVTVGSTKAYRENLNRYTAKLQYLDDNVATFSVQKFQTDAAYVSEIDNDGIFLYVADFKREGESRTKIESYRTLLFSGDIADAVKKWSRGEKIDCPMELN